MDPAVGSLRDARTRARRVPYRFTECRGSIQMYALTLLPVCREVRRKLFRNSIQRPGGATTRRSKLVSKAGGAVEAYISVRTEGVVRKVSAGVMHSLFRVRGNT